MAVRKIYAWRDTFRRLLVAFTVLIFPGGRYLFRVLAQVNGHLSPQEAVFLFWLACKVPGKGEVVEIGSFCGRSTLCLAAGLHRRGEGRLFTIDPHVYGSEQGLLENLKLFGACDRVEVVVGPSVSVALSWKKPVRMLFVDGNHELGNVVADVLAWGPHMEPGGFIVLHDSTSLSGLPGPKKAAKWLYSEKSTYECAGTIGTISWFRLKGAASPWLPPQYGKSLIDRFLAVRKEWRKSPDV